MDINEGILLIKKLTHKKSCSPQRLGKVSIDGENNYANALDSPFREKKKSVDRIEAEGQSCKTVNTLGQIYKRP